MKAALKQSCSHAIWLASLARHLVRNAVTRYARTLFQKTDIAAQWATSEANALPEAPCRSADPQLRAGVCAASCAITVEEVAARRCTTLCGMRMAGEALRFKACCADWLKLRSGATFQAPPRLAASPQAAPQRRAPHPAQERALAQAHPAWARRPNRPTTLPGWTARRMKGMVEPDDQAPLALSRAPLAVSV